MVADVDTDPETVVQQQVDAYNQGNIDAFVDCYAETAVVSDLDEDETLGRGREAIRAQYGELFEQFPNLNCEVTAEFTVGEYVVSREHVTGMGEPKEALAIYHVQEGLIQHLWTGESE